MKLSATIITLNEERNIERCINSLQDVADEIIVLDSKSTDRTVEIAKKLGARVEVRNWEGYSANKNYLNHLATGDYIFSIDADEAVDAELAATIQNIKQQDQSSVFSVNRLTNYCGKWIKHSGWYPDVIVRIFPKAGCQWVGAYIHEQLSFPKQMKVVQLAGHLKHYSYYNFVEHRARADKYSALTAQKLNELGKTAGPFKPYLSALVRFITMYFLRLGFLDGRMGYKIAAISAQSNIFKYKELRRLNSIRDDRSYR